LTGQVVKPPLRGSRGPSLIRSPHSIPCPVNFITSRGQPFSLILLCWLRDPPVPSFQPLHLLPGKASLDSPLLPIRPGNCPWQLHRRPPIPLRSRKFLPGCDHLSLFFSPRPGLPGSSFSFVSFFTKTSVPQFPNVHPPLEFGQLCFFIYCLVAPYSPFVPFPALPLKELFLGVPCLSVDEQTKKKNPPGSSLPPKVFLFALFL